DRAGAKLEIDSCRQRSLAEGQSPRLPRRADVAGGQRRPVRPRGSHADRDRIRRGAQLVNETPALLARDPARSGQRQPAVERLRCLVGDEGPALHHPRQPGLDLLPSPKAELTLGDLRLDAGVPKLLQAARGLWIRVPRPDDDLLDTGVDHRLCTGRRRAPARAWLERDIERGAASVIAGGRERVYLGMRLALPLVPALADDLTVLHEHGPDDRVRLGRPAPALGELERPLEEAHLKSPFHNEALCRRAALDGTGSALVSQSRPYLLDTNAPCVLPRNRTSH